MNFRSYKDLTQTIISNIDKIPNDIDLIVGIPRSGLLVANIIALYKNLPLTDLEGMLENRLISSGTTKNTSNHISSIQDCKKILIVDDSVCSGKSIKDARKKIENMNQNFNIIYFAAYVIEDTKNLVDIYLEVVPLPRVFEWNIFHHTILEKACFDIDGVLCSDPADNENDDGSEYLKFLLNAKPKIIPTVPIGALVTSRLNKYKGETCAWIEKNRIMYQEIVMMDCTFEERRKKGNHAKFKADYYKTHDYVIFIESDPSQAIEISRISNKPVYCTGNGEFYDGGILYKFKEKTEFKALVKSILFKIPFGESLLMLYKNLRNKS